MAVCEKFKTKFETFSKGRGIYAKNSKTYNGYLKGRFVRNNHFSHKPPLPSLSRFF